MALPSPSRPAIDQRVRNRVRQRIVVALAIGIACGTVSWLATRVPRFDDQDFSLLWRGARVLLRGQSLYATVPRFFYPLPAALAVIPLAWLPVTIGGPIFVAVSCALLAFAVTAVAWWPLMMFLSGSMLLNVFAAQSAAWLTAGFILPWLTWLGVFKPNIGLVMLAYRPSLRSAIVMLAIAAASLIVHPSWPAEWVRTASASVYHFALWRGPGGVLLFLALARWRRPEARMLAMFAVVPSSPIVYEAMPLFVIPKTRREMVVLVVLSDIMFLVMANLNMLHPDAYMGRARPAIVWLMYIPALVMVLRRPNEGPGPASVR